MCVNSNRLKLLSLGLKRKIQCYNGYFTNENDFQSKDYKEGKNTYSNEICIKGSIVNEFKVDYY